MPVVLEQGASRRSLAPLNGARPASADPARSDGAIEIGIVNNMPDSALESTERQFIDLLAAASGGAQVRVRLFSLPQIPRGDLAQRLLAEYSDIGRLWEAQLDGLIVTGMEPGPGPLSDEPYWRAFTDLIDWAERNTTSSIWSCLAAHAVVLHRDGIERRPLLRPVALLFLKGVTCELSPETVQPPRTVPPALAEGLTAIVYWFGLTNLDRLFGSRRRRRWVDRDKLLDCSSARRAHRFRGGPSFRTGPGSTGSAIAD